jgi:hypothetical protein
MKIDDLMDMFNDEGKRRHRRDGDGYEENHDSGYRRGDGTDQERRRLRGNDNEYEDDQDHGYRRGEGDGNPGRRLREGNRHEYYDRKHEHGFDSEKLKVIAGKVMQNKVLLVAVIIGGIVVLCLVVWLLSVVLNIIGKNGIKGVLDMVSSSPLKWLWEGSEK